MLKSLSEISANGITCAEKCVACDSPHLAVFYRSDHVPVCVGSLWDSRREALHCPMGDIALALCEDCGIIINTRFDPALIDYRQPYENSLDGSGVFRNYAHSLAKRLVQKHDLYGKRVVEIGCGNGRFLDLLCEIGDNQGVGFDPSYDPGGDPIFDGTLRCSKVRIVPEVYSEQYAELPVDFLCCRQVLEHIPAPKDFLASLRRIFGAQNRIGRTGVYFEVPNAMHTLRGGEFSGPGLWTIIYKHCVYYGAAALVRLFETAGFEVCSVTEDYDGQFLGIEAYAKTPLSGTAMGEAVVGWDHCPDLIAPGVGRDNGPILRRQRPHEIAECAAMFQKRFGDKLNSLHNTLRRAREQGTPAVIWGAGARGVSLLNSLEDASLVHCAVDINPRKQGKFMAGTGHEILPPEGLRQVQPGVVIVMNDIYGEEIAKSLQSLGLQSELEYA